MPIIDNGPDLLTRGVPLTLYDAVVVGGVLPGLFTGKMRPQILASGDTIKVTLQGRTTPNATDDDEVIKIMLDTDNHFYLTPLAAYTQYKLIVELEAGSPSATINLDWELARSAAP